MRASILVIGLVIILFGLLLDIGIGYPIIITGTIGLVNIILGIITPKSPGLVFLSDPAAKVKLIVDKGRSRSGIYQLVFLDNRLIMKKLTALGAINAVTLVFAIAGGLIGGATGYSLQEYLTERKRRKIQEEHGLMVVGPADMEIPYETMSQVELTKTRLKLSSPNGPIALILGKKYPPLIATKLRELIPNRSWAGTLQTTM